MQVAILGGRLLRHAERHAARHDRHAVERLGVRAVNATIACPASCTATRRFSPRRACLARIAEHDLVVAAVKSTRVDRSPRRAGSRERGLVDEVREVGAGEAGRLRGDRRSRSTSAASGLPACGPRGSPRAPRELGAIDDDAPIEAAGPQQRRVEHVGPVGRGQDDDADRCDRSRPSRRAAGSASARARRGRRRGRRRASGRPRRSRR